VLSADLDFDFDFDSEAWQTSLFRAERMAHTHNISRTESCGKNLMRMDVEVDARVDAKVHGGRMLQYVGYRHLPINCIQ
jgi:hypothetical protein